MNDRLIDLIDQKKIINISTLKLVYHTQLKKIHPDTSGKDDRIDQCIQLVQDYQSAKIYLETLQKTNYEKGSENRYNFYLTFFNQLNLENEPTERFGTYLERLFQADDDLFRAFCQWKPEESDLFERAQREYMTLREEKPHNSLDDLRKTLKYTTLVPFLYGVVRFHLTGRDIYFTQIKRTSRVVYQLHQVENKDLKEWLLFLLDDVEKGAALILDS